MSNRSSQNSLHEDLLELVTRTTCHGLTSWGFAWGVPFCISGECLHSFVFPFHLGPFLLSLFADLESVFHCCFPSSRRPAHDVQSVFHLLLTPQFASVSMESVLHCLCVSFPPWDCIAFPFSFSRKCPPFPFSLLASVCA